MILKPPLFAKPIHGHPLGPDRGLAGCWPMNEGRYNSTFNKVFDLSGNGNDGIITGSPPWIAGKYGPALKFEGNDEIDSTGLYVTDTATIIIRLKIDDTSASEFLLDCRDGDADNVQIYLRGVTPVVELWDTEIKSSHTITGLSGVWTDWAFVFNGVGNATAIYKNGVKGGSSSNNQITTNIIENRIEIGCRFTQATYFNGAVEFLHIYNRALSASEIALLYREPFCMFEQDPIEFWSAATQGEEVPPVGMAGAMTTNTGYWGW